jgi:hypothetical protein
VFADGDVVADDDRRAPMNLDGASSADRDAVADDEVGPLIDLDVEVVGQVTIVAQRQRLPVRGA